MAKILIHSLIFSPDGVSTAYLYNDIAMRFRKEGYEVVVLSTTPHFNVVESQLEKQPLKWKIWGFLKESEFNGIKVYHVPQKKFRSTFMRLLGFVYWHVISFFVGLFIRNVDVILSPSPPLTIGILNLWLGKLKKCKVIYNVQEIYPDILNLKEGMVLKFLRRMERRVYNSSAAVTTIDRIFHDAIVGRFKDPSRLHIIPNFVDTDLYHPMESTDSLDKSLFPQSASLKLLYAGNIGFAQSWEPLVLLADKARGLDVEFLVIGEGVMKPYLEEKKRELGLDKLHILPYQPRELMPEILAYSDVQFIFMDPKMDMQGFPSKVYTIMACARPLLVCSGEGTPIVNFLGEVDCAKLVCERDLEKKVDQMYEWLENVSADELKVMGQNGVGVIRKQYAKDIVTSKYVDLVRSL